MSTQSKVLTKKSAGIAALVAVVLAAVVAVGLGTSSASAAPGGNKGKPTPTPTVTATVTPTPTPTVTATVDPNLVVLSCYITNGYVVADYSSGAGTIYEGAVLSDGVDLDGNLNVLASFGTSTHTKFLSTMLPQGVIVKVNMVATDGSVVASCDVNTGYYNPYN